MSVWSTNNPAGGQIYLPFHQVRVQQEDINLCPFGQVIVFEEDPFLSISQTKRSSKSLSGRHKFMSNCSTMSLSGGHQFMFMRSTNSSVGNIN